MPMIVKTQHHMLRPVCHFLIDDATRDLTVKYFTIPDSAVSRAFMSSLQSVTGICALLQSSVFLHDASKSVVREREMERDFKFCNVALLCRLCIRKYFGQLCFILLNYLFVSCLKVLHRLLHFHPAISLLNFLCNCLK